MAQAAQQSANQAAATSELTAPAIALGSEGAIAAAATQCPIDQPQLPRPESPGLEAGCAAAVLAGPRDDAQLCGGDHTSYGCSPPRDDAMGGGASDGIVNKRPVAESLDAARAIAAKAKARAGN